MTDKKRIIGAALGQCVHVAGLSHFLDVCEANGWQTTLLGPAVPPATLAAIVREEQPDAVAISYRLTAEDLRPLLEELSVKLRGLPAPRPRLFFGGTPPAAEAARGSGLFEAVFDGSEAPEAVERFVNGERARKRRGVVKTDLLSRIEASFPLPLIRHHYGEPDLAATVRGAARIARSRALDVLSIGPDQNAQEHFFHPECMDPQQDGAGGVPVRQPSDLEAIYQATRRGNYPLVRCYSGTRDLIPWADMSVAAIKNAWGAIPLCWYSVMDGRSKVEFPEAIREKQAAMRFYAGRGIPVEVNESHQWSLRDAHDALAVTMAFLAAYNAKAQGVKHYVIQLMFNTPPSTSPSMDLAKMQAKLEMIKTLEGPDFTTYREVRAGITSLPSDPNEAKGHMAASATYAMALRPHILHVVGYSEASHVVTPTVLIESCKIARGAVRLALKQAPDPGCDPVVRARKEHLLSEVQILLEGIKRIGCDSADPWADAEVLTKAIQLGVLDAPHFRGNPHLCGQIVTACIDGGWNAIDRETRLPVTERQRLSRLGLEW